MTDSRERLREAIRRIVRFATAAALLSLVSVALAEPPLQVVGEPAGPAPRERLDPDRRGRSPVRLPLRPVERWRVDLRGPLETLPVVDRTGSLVAWLARGDLVRVSVDGAIAWRVPIPCTPSMVPLALLPSGEVVALCGDGTLHRVARDGARLKPIELGATARQTDAAPAVRNDGSLVVALDSELVHVGADGAILARAKLSGDVLAAGGLVPHEGGVAFATMRGEVYQWSGALEPRRLGAFGGAVREGLVRLGARAFAAVVDGDRVVVLDPLNGETRVAAATDGDATLEGPPSLAPNGELLVTTNVGELFVIGPARGDLRSIALEPPQKVLPNPKSARRAGRGPRWSPPLVIDPEGRVAYARHHGAVGFGGVGPSGMTSFEPLGGAPCTRPRALVPAGERRLVAGCGDGTLVAWSDP